MSVQPMPATDRVLQKIRDEREAQDAKWGEQNHPDGTTHRWRSTADYYRDLCDGKFEAGEGSWVYILLEEVYEALAEEDPDLLRTELIQVAAVATAWVEAIDRR